MPRIYLQPIFWAGLYFLAIPLFALIYDCMPGQFYAPYAHLESNTKLDGAKVGLILQRALYSEIATHSDIAFQSTVGTNSYINASFWDIKIDGDKLRSELLIYADTQTQFYDEFDDYGSKISTLFYGNIAINVSPDFVWGLVSKDSIPDNNFHKIHLEPDDSIDSIIDEKSVLQFFRPAISGIFSSISPVVHQPNIYLRASDEREFSEFVSGYNGDPTHLNGAYLRMLYLSVISITTVGFGDIVPMTLPARLLIGFEAIIGIVIGGLFVGTLSSSRVRAVGSSASQPAATSTNAPEEKVQPPPTP